MTTSHQLLPVDGPQIIPVTDGSIRSYAVALSFAMAPSAGTVTVETQAIGSMAWVPVTRGVDIDVMGGHVDLSFDGAVRFIRVTFSGLVGGFMPILWVSSQGVFIPTFDLLTDGGNGPNRRMRVDVGQTGFFGRRMWRSSYEITALGGTPIVLKVLMATNFIIHHQSLSVDEGGIGLRAYRIGQGTEGGTFSTVVPLYSVNFMDEKPEYAFQASVTTGGTFTPSAPAVETTRIRSANATAQATTVGGTVTGERGLAASTYYLVFSQLPGVSGNSAGVYSLIVEERP